MQMHHHPVTNLPHRVQVQRHTPPTRTTEKQSGSPPTISWRTQIMEDGKTPENPRRTTVKRVVLTVAVVVAGTGAILGGAFATFTDTTSAGPQSITSGKVILAVGPTNDSTTTATNIAPGDTIPREVDLNSTTATLNDATITLGISASPSSLLDSDATNGLQVQVQTCSVAWTRTPGPPPTYICGGTTVAVLASTPVKTLESSPANLTPLNSLTAGGQDYVVMTFSFPSTAPGNIAQVPVCSGTAGGTALTENLEGCSSTLTYTFTATQRAGTSK
jgi:spore coat-associated protein N